MTEPVTSLATAGTVAATVGVAAWLSGLDPEAVFGAFAGATTFALTARDTSWVPRLMYALISLVVGYAAVPDVAAQLPVKSPLVIAFAVSAIVVHLTVTVIDRIRSLDVRAVWDAVMSVWRKGVDMQSLTAGIVIAANFYSLAWLLTFRRGDATYKPWVSIVAYALVLALGGQIVEVGLNHALATVADTGLAVLVAVFIHRVRGNVACLLWGRGVRMEQVKAVRGIIETAFALLPVKMNTQAATCIQLAICGQEADFHHRWQVIDRKRPEVRGPARGLWQFERGGGVRGVLTFPATREDAYRVCVVQGVQPVAASVHPALESDDLLAAAFARLLMWTDAYRLPALGDEEGAWQMYLRTGAQGAHERGTQAERELLRRKWTGYYNQALREVTQ